ncbi:aromatase/cyclase [Nocardiopsis nanhaiensis]
MSGAREHRALHSRVFAARPETLYQLVERVENWPVVFEPTIHVHLLERGSGSERFRIWATVNGEVADWTSRRRLDPRTGVITFQQEHSRPPLTSMRGEWRFVPLPGGRTEVSLVHVFSADGDEAVEWINRALDGNSERELDALARIAELPHSLDDLVLSFEDTARIAGDPRAAYRFVERADAWPDLLPHVGRVALVEPKPGVQDLEMDTVTRDGDIHTTRSIRLCLGEQEIVYKQTRPPRLVFGHGGAWGFGAGGLITARHTVAINPDAVSQVLGPEAGVHDARSYLREALGANSRVTLSHAVAAAEGQELTGTDRGPT